MKKLLIFTLAIISSLNLYAQEDKDKEFKAKIDKIYAKKDNVLRNVVYKKVGDKELCLDIIQPEKQLYKNGSPAIVMIHGGGWSAGQRFIINDEKMKKYSEQGITLVPISYRLVPQSPDWGIEECVIDCFDAARFLAKNAEKYNLDLSRMGVYGHSAGGHLCLMLALAPSEEFLGDESLKDEKFKVLCAVASAPISSFIDEDINANTKSGRNRSHAVSFFKSKYEDNYDLRKKLSPITYLKKDSPKVQIPHGTSDTACPVEDSRRMHKASVGLNEIEYIEIEGATHGFGKKGVDEKRLEYKANREFELYKEYLLKDIEKI